MTDPPSWNRALTLSERDFLFPEASTPAGFDPALAGRRAETWAKETQLDRQKLPLRLRQQGLDEARFAHLLGSPPPRPQDPPAWWTELEAAYATPAESPDAPGRSAAWRQTVEGQPDAVFLEILDPLLEHAWHRLMLRLGKAGIDVSHGPLARFAELWIRPLPKQLLWMFTRTLILELYLCRLEGTLEGSTPEARFESFLARLREPAGALDLFAAYPVLARSLTTRLRQWLDVGEEFVRRLRGDLPTLSKAFGEDGRGWKLVDLDTGLGDRHADGRTVIFFELVAASQEDDSPANVADQAPAIPGVQRRLRLIYKPRSLALDVRFQELLSWLGDQGVEPRSRTLKVLDRGDYGWVEFVEQAPCRDLAEARRFFRRQGVHLALLYALEATDFHHENLIAAGEYPVLIDLETLFQPVLADAEQARERLNPVFTTILRSGLLPRRTGGGGDANAVDLSGLGAERGQRAPVRELTRVGTDEMGFIDRLQSFPVGKHLPSLEGANLSLRAMAGELQEGFEHGYRKLLELRPQMLAPGGWLDRFAALQTRVVVRPTNVYSHLAYGAFHPDFLQDSLHRERLFDKLWIDADLLEWIPQIIPVERRALMRGDIPHFHALTDSRHLQSDGLEFENIFPESGLDLTRRRLAAMGEEDLERQLALFHLALTSSRRLDEPQPDEPQPDEPQPDDTADTQASDARALRPLPKEGPKGEPSRSADEFLRAAGRLGERLETLAFHAQDWISWFHLAPNPDGTQSLQPVGYDLYSGLGGIALFYAQLGRLDHQGDRWTRIARRALATARERQARQIGPRQGNLGGFSGLGGWIYTLTYLGALWDEPELLETAEAARQAVLPAIDDDEGLDIIAGSAGCIGALLALYRHRPDAATLHAAVACGNHLLKRAEPRAAGIGWRLPALADEPLTGFAHGTAGFAWALAHLAAASGEAKFEDAARAALAYERSLFSPEHENWPDLRIDRQEGGQWSYFHAWCHGAPGIGSSRLDLLDVLDDGGLKSEVRAAVSSTRASGFGGSQCLCHGDLGNLELLLRASRRLEDADLEASARKLAGQILNGLERDGARCGISSRVELPGLLTGLAGIGYGLLQAAFPTQIPSVLTLKTPDGKAPGEETWSLPDIAIPALASQAGRRRGPSIATPTTTSPTATASTGTTPTTTSPTSTAPAKTSEDPASDTIRP